MDNYGEPVLSKDNNLIGYKLNDYEYAPVETLYNGNNLLSNKILIKDFNSENLSFVGEVLISCIDTKTEFGFIRELDNFRYFYDLNNEIFNVEVIYNQPKFPIYKLDTNLNDKIGTIDLETYGSNLGLGHHEVFYSCCGICCQK